MGLFKEYALFRKPVDIWCLRLGMSSEAAHPIVQIVDRDEQNVGPINRAVGNDSLDRQTENGEECEHREARSGTRREFRSSA